MNIILSSYEGALFGFQLSFQLVSQEDASIQIQKDQLFATDCHSGPISALCMYEDGRFGYSGGKDERIQGFDLGELTFGEEMVNQGLGI